jgi:signal transduction histidine kinase
MRILRVTSLRRRFLLVVIVGAVLPLALVGWWLTRTAVRSGASQLTAALDSSLDAITDRVQRRWVYRRGELTLLADNDVVRRTLRGELASAADSAYLVQLFDGVSRTMPTLRYRDVNHALRWAMPAEPVAPLDSALQRDARHDNTFTVRLPVRGMGRDSMRVIGELEARVRLAAVLPIEESQSVVGHAVLDVVDRATGAPLFARESPAGHNWITVRRTLDQPPLDFSLAAPAAAYVEPFERAAQLGLIALCGVAALVILLSSYLTKRLTSSLEDLVTATTAVARGDLQRNVSALGDDEVARLAEAFNAMTESLRRTLRNLSRQEALAAVGEYAATLSHEVRNALSAVRMDLQRAEEQAHDPSKARALVSRSLENVRRLDLIVSGSLRVVRQGQHVAQTVDLDAVLRRAVESAEPAFAATGAVLEADGNGSADHWVEGDPAALEQLFLNLLVNAGQALTPGGHAQMETGEADGRYVVTIRDTGVGIPADQLARVGELFYSSKQGGTGLGLTIARRIVAGHGGELDIQSAPGQGTTVRVSLPSSRTRGRD